MRINMRVLIAAIFAAACDVPAPTQLSATPGLVVFSVLDPAAVEQTVLLMQTRPAVSDTTARTVNVDDPIVTAGEIPVTGARVVLYGPTGDSAVAIEDRVRRADHLGAGVYRFYSSGNAATLPAGAYMPIAMGARYRLQVQSSVGIAEASTHVPSNDRNLNVAARLLNFSRDSIILGQSVAEAAGFIYSLRNGNATEGSPQYRRGLERRLVLPSGNDWAFAYVRERFTIGSRHTLTVTATDSSYFGYYSSEGDPFADRSTKTSLRGAAGVFGSVLLMYSSTVTVVSTQSSGMRSPD